MSEEQIVANLEKGYLKGTHCGACNKVIVNKTKLTEQESATETIFNTKKLLFTCDNHRKKNKCSFCMCRKCFVDVSNNKDKENKNEGVRKSTRKRNK